MRGAQIRPGRAVQVINLSAGGALVDTCHRLLPGVEVDMQLETAERRFIVRGRVLRCAVIDLRPSSVRYRGAIGFERQVPWLVDESCRDGYALPDGAGNGGPSFPPASDRSPL